MTYARLLLALPAALAVGLLSSAPARAQSGNTALPMHAPVVPQTAIPGGPKSKGPPPPALPGAQSQPNSAAPATRQAADMPPTEALFDAISRGDIAAARDALNRGADLNGRNELGMTPLDTSIDRGRNDISFLLLSMRGQDGSGSTAARSAAAPVASAPAAPGRGGREVAAHQGARASAARTKLARGRVGPPATNAASAASGGFDLDSDEGSGPAPAAMSVTRRDVRHTVRARPGQDVASEVPMPPASAGDVVPMPPAYAGSGGAPVPQAGFLGFDGSRTR